MNAPRRVHIRVKGVVQGVGFRFYVRRVARDLGLVGYVRNSADGSVELEAEGEPSGVSALIDAVDKGPSGAFVRNTTVRQCPVRSSETEFVLRW